MSAQVASAKRPYDQSFAEGGGRRKWQKSSGVGSDNASFIGSSSGGKIIRLLFPASRVGGIIGKGGSTISQIRQETGAKVRVEESVPGCDERVIIIVGSDRDNENVTKQIKSEGEETKNPELTANAEEDEKQAVPVDDSRPEKEKEPSSVQKALLVVFDKMVAILSDTKEVDEEGNKPSSFVVRLLVFSGQVGCLLGKGGSVIKQMSSESGAQIRILPKDKLPSCSSSSDELVQITGKQDAIKKALLSVSQNLVESFIRNQDSFPINMGGQSSQSFGPPSRQDRFPPPPPPHRPFHGHGEPYSSSVFHDGEPIMPVRGNFPPEVLTFRLLCNEEKVGGVIGKGGSIVKALQHETGCDIKVLDGAGDSEDRIIIISGPAYPDDGVSAPQDAVLRVQARIFRAAPENKDNTMAAKLLVSSNQIGCLLGKGGSVIAEMRKSTGAYIRILGKEQVPKNASENEEVVLASGEFEVVQEALMQITARLKNHLFRDVFPPYGHPPNPGFMEQMPPFPPYMPRREFSPPGPYSNRGPSFNNFDGPGGIPPGGGFHPRDDHPPFGHDFPGPGIPPHMSERMPPAAPWGPQGPMDGPGPMGFPDYPGAPQRRHGGFPGGNQSAVITSTTVEVVVPRFVVPAIYGEDGGCIRQIREISDAKITITDPKPGASETVIIISGTPEQTNAAQSLIQAFVISETESA
ncbi:hypothetical protein ACP275_03G031900 [Erythranthe tilingii]